MDTLRTTPTPKDALLIVDVQVDFLPGGNLAVPDSHEIIPVLNRYISLFNRRQCTIVATRDWHPSDHCSFRSRGGVWPPHCIADTAGAAFAPDLALPPEAIVISKATAADEEAYSGFQGTALADRLRGLGVRRLFVGGLATDVCVLNTVKDAISEGFEVVLLLDAVRAVDVQPNDGAKAIAEMKALGAVAVEALEVAARRPFADA